MPISTDLSRAPYFDDYNEKDNYHRILFKPSVAVQVRELNQLQTILQNQVERFGDNIYKRGTIIDGCNLTFHSNLQYVKINDSQTDGAPVNVSSFKGLFAKNSNNVIAQIVETATGFESTPPNLNTLHLKYLTSGTDGSPAFKPEQVLTIYNPSLIVSEADVEIKSSGFSNTDNLVIISAIEVSNTIGGDTFVNASGQACTFVVGETITQDITGAQAQIMEVNATANVETLILKIRPLASNLRLANSVSWLFAENYQFTSSQSNITGVLQRNIGKDAFGTIVTDSSGGVKSVAILNGGTGYYVEPWITVAYATPNTSTGSEGLINNLLISSKNYLCNVTINEDTASVGSGVGIAVSEGIIYQKGHFIRVSDQFLVVDKYNPQTNNVVGFDTLEEIVNFRVDQNLLDNASGTLNERAPGADRLKLTPKLVSITKETADANNIFLPIVEYSLGKPARQRKSTQFNSISKELAQRTFEQSGNYVLDQFLISTEDVDDIGFNYISYRLKADPGTAYINGYRVQTFAPTAVNAPKAITATPPQQTSVSLSYGNYIVIRQVAGLFNFAVGGKISLRDQAATYVSSSMAAQGSSQFPVPTAAGNEIGTAKIRSMQIQKGYYGGPFAQHNLYIFDIKMNRGKNFKDVRSIFYDGDGDRNGIADILLDGGNAVLYSAKNSTMLFPSGLQAISSINSVSYTYRTVAEGLTLSTSGIVTATVAQNPGESMAYQSLLDLDDKETLHLVPFANAIATTSAGTVLVQGASYGNLVAGTANFNTSFRPGDYIRVANSGGDFEIKRIAKIANATHLTVQGTFTNNLGAATATLFFPQYAPIELRQARRTANVQSNTTLTINIANSISSAVPVYLSFNVRKTSNSVPKKITRNAFVKINPANNVGGMTGPWCLGLPDILRLREVYEGNTVTFNGNSTIVSSADDFISFTNDFLSDGDIVVYASATGNSVVTGLTNNQSYYVKSSNSTGVKLSLTSTGSAIELSPTGANTTQYLMYVSNTSTRVTENFYIDHNQRKDYYDIGYLYKQTNYTVPSNKVLLAQFDVMSTNENGMKTIASYPIIDTVPLANNTAGIHTLEIPELVHDNGEYFDLRDTLDFRPYSTNTVAIATTVSSAPLNPAELDPNSRFNFAVDKKFPLPGSVCDFTVSRYLPRVDSIVLFGNSAISIIQGTPQDKPKAPTLPKEGLLLNHLIVPPYPSLPKTLSAATLEYVNKNILNVVGIKKRLRDYTVTTPISPEGLPTIQSKPYTMQDIASLERRIADLEYYTSLSFTEDRVNNLQLTSSVDTTTNRFKFGFFVDNFTTSNFAEVGDPAYYAQIFGFELNPKKKQFKIEYSFNMRDPVTASCIRGKKLMLPSREVNLIGQKQATEATTIKIATTETTFTTTGTEITSVTTNIKEITTQEWALKTQEQQYQTLTTTTNQVKKKVTKQRTVVKHVEDTPGLAWMLNNTRYATPGGVVGGNATEFFGSKLGGAIYSGWTNPNPHRNLGTYDGVDRGVGAYGNYIKPGASYGGTTSGYGGTPPKLQRNDGTGWNDVTPTAAYTTNGWGWTIYYKYPASSVVPKFRFYETSSYTTSDIDQIAWTRSKEVKEIQNYEVEEVVNETTSRYDPAVQTIYKVDSTTNVTTKEEVLTDVQIEEKTTSITKSLFNPKPSALMRMEQLFNLPGSINSPTIDLLSFIQDDINS